MNLALIFNGIVFTLFLFFFFTQKKKCIESLNIAKTSFMKFLPLLFIVIIMMICLQNVFTREFISDKIEFTSEVFGYLFAALIGAIVQMPHFIAFPIGGELLNSGVNPGMIAVLITSLVMVHTFSIPIEIKEMGWKFAVVRNLSSFVFSILIGIIVGVLY